MRFKLLLEKYPYVNADAKDTFEKSNNDGRKRIIAQVISNFSNPNANKLKNSITYGANTWGVSAQGEGETNPFFSFVDKLLNSKVPLNNQVDTYLSHYIDMVKSGVVQDAKGTFNGGADYLFEPSLYQRNKDDFDFTVRAFELLRNPTLAKKYFKDISVLNKEELFTNGKIKPVGTNKDLSNPNTLRGLFEIWSTGNDAGKSSNKDGNIDFDSIVSKLKLDSKRAQMLKNSISLSIEEWGEDPNKNYFLTVAKELINNSNLMLKSRHDKLLSVLVEKISNGKMFYPNELQLALDELKIPSLYERDADEFLYTLYLFVKDADVLFSNTDEVDYSKLMSGSNIKPFGDIDGLHDESTILGTIQSWGPKLKQFQLDKSNSKSGLTNKEKRRIKKENSYYALSEVPSDVRESGEIVYARASTTKLEDGDIPKDISGFYKFKNGKWHKVANDINS